jgi:hypothetical protein
MVLREERHTMESLRFEWHGRNKRILSVTYEGGYSLAALQELKQSIHDEMGSAKYKVDLVLEFRNPDTRTNFRLEDALKELMLPHPNQGRICFIGVARPYEILAGMIALNHITGYEVYYQCEQGQAVKLLTRLREGA